MLSGEVASGCSRTWAVGADISTTSASAVTRGCSRSDAVRWRVGSCKEAGTRTRNRASPGVRLPRGWDRGPDDARTIVDASTMRPLGSTASTAISAAVPAASFSGATTKARCAGGILRSRNCWLALPWRLTDRASAKSVPGGTTTGTRTVPSAGAMTGPNSLSPTFTVTRAPGSVRKAGLAAARSRTARDPRRISESREKSATTIAACGKREDGRI